MVRPRATGWEFALGFPAGEVVVLGAEGAEADGHEGVFGLLFVVCELPRGDFEVVPVETCR